METKDIQKIIDRAVGTEGILRIPSWWMHKILSDLVQYCDSLKSSDASITEYLESQLNLVGDAVEALDARVTEVESHELFAIVSELPAEPKENTIYLVPSANGEAGNVLTEWVYVNDAWEQFGEFKADVDLSGYVTKEEGKGLSANDYTDEDKEKVSSLKNYDDTEVKEKLTELSAAKEDKANKVTSLSDESTDTQYPSAKCVHESLSSLKEEVMSNGVLIEDLQNMKIDKENDDYYPKMAVGLADNLAGVDVVDSEINFRRSGGGAISDGVARIESIKGNSVVWNQLINTSSNSATTTENGVTFTKNEDGSFSVVTDSAGATANTFIQLGRGISVINTHKYILCGAAQGGKYETYNAYAINGFASSIYDYGAGAFGTSIGGKTFVVIMVKSGQVISSPLKFSMKFIDLTQMFGSGNEPTTIEDFYARIPMGVDMNAYNEGEVIHMDVQSVESVGVNQWDEEWEKGKFSTTDGTNQAADGTMRMVNKVVVLPNTKYYMKSPVDAWVLFYDKDGKVIEGYSTGISTYQNACNVKDVTFTTPSNAASMRAYFNQYFASVVGYQNDICLNLSNSGLNGKYFPYIKRVEDLSIIRKYFPQGMKSAGTAHDEIRYNKASGKWEKVVRIGEVKMKDLSWTMSSNVYFADFDKMKWVKASGLGLTGGYTGLLTNKYDAVGYQSFASMVNYDKGIGVASSASRILLYDSAYTDIMSFVASLTDDDVLYYELAEPIVTELDEADQFKDLDYQVWNDGTEKAIVEGKSAPLVADITYGFNAIGKIKELEEAIKALQTKVASL